MRISDWTPKEIAQGKPWAHPTHAMFIHFPTALYPVALAFGLFSYVQRSGSAADAATVLLGLGILATIPAALTGLLDWSGMVTGSTKRRAATKHMLNEIVAFVLATLALVAFLIGRDGPAPLVGLVVLGAAVAVMFAGNWLGGVLVYRMAMRVGGSTTPPTRRGVAPTIEPITVQRSES